LLNELLFSPTLILPLQRRGRKKEYIFSSSPTLILPLQRRGRIKVGVLIPLSLKRKDTSKDLNLILQRIQIKILI